MKKHLTSMVVNKSGEAKSKFVNHFSIQLFLAEKLRKIN
jgi:hypothetical protein